MWHRTGQVVRFLDRTTTLLLGLYFILKPFYVFESGMPQPADLIMVLVFMFTLLKLLLSHRASLVVEKHSYQCLRLAFFLGLYTVLVNGVWTLALGQASFLQSSIWYIYNDLVLLTVTLLCQEMGQSFLKATSWFIAVSVTVQAALAVQANSGQRVALYLNNPNQLGYYGLLSLCIVLAIQERVRIRHDLLSCGVVYWVLIAGALVVIASLSKAAIISTILLFICFAFKKMLKNRRRWTVLNVNILILLVVCLLVVKIAHVENSFVGSAVARLGSIGSEPDDSLAGRGYDRIWNNPEYLIFGAGEGGYERFESRIRGSEIHSTFGNILVSYGFVGFVAFTWLVFVGIRERGLTSYYPLFCALLYGLVHNGIRHTFFWVLLAIIHTETID